MSQLVGDVAHWVTEVVYFFHYPGVFVLMALSNMYLPIPSQLVLPLSGFLVRQGRFSFPLVILASTAGSVVGTLVLYAAGHWLGEKPLRRFFKRYGRFVFLDESSLEKANGWYERHGGEDVLGRSGFGRAARHNRACTAGYERDDFRQRLRSFRP